MAITLILIINLAINLNCQWNSYKFKGYFMSQIVNEVNEAFIEKLNDLDEFSEDFLESLKKLLQANKKIKAKEIEELFLPKTDEIQ